MALINELAGFSGFVLTMAFILLAVNLPLLCSNQHFAADCICVPSSIAAACKTGIVSD